MDLEKLVTEALDPTVFKPEHWIALGSLAVAAVALISGFVREGIARRYESRTRFHRERLQYVADFLGRCSWMAINAETAKGKLSDSDARELTSAYHRVILVGTKEMCETAELLLDFNREIMDFEQKEAQKEEASFEEVLKREHERKKLHARRLEIEAVLVSVTQLHVEPHTEGWMARRPWEDRT